MTWNEYHQQIFSRSAFIIPVYNHGGRIKGVVEKTVAQGRPVFVVNDGSTDHTGEVLASLEGIVVLTHEQNQGKGAALLTGFSAAAEVADWAITLDADGQHDPAEAARLIEAVRPGARPMVVGRRKGMDDENVPWTSRWGRRFSNFWVWVASGLWVTDTQTGFRLYPLAEILKLRPRSRRFEFEMEIVVLAAWWGMPVIEAEIGVVYQPGAERISHFHPTRDFIRNSKAMSRLIPLRFIRRLMPGQFWKRD